MNTVLANWGHFWAGAAPYLGLFLGALALSLLLTPVFREAARKLGMVDVPSARRINKVPVPRGAGVAIFLACLIALGVYVFAFDGRIFDHPGKGLHHRFAVLSVLALVLSAVGLWDDRFGLRPRVKLLGQVAVALGAYFFAGAGFHYVWPMIPGWLDCPLTVFWIVGAVNAFNLIDGLDGLATGLAVIACLGMAGALFFLGRPDAALPYFAFCGACLGFLRYNFHPASVFLGDAGSMNIGFFLATVPILSGSPGSIFVSLGIPILAMGVPIFDTSLAILRRTLRAFLRRQENRDEGNTHVMQPDTDHLHHRILRASASQRKAAFGLYAMAAFLVAVPVVSLAFQSRAAALFILGFLVAASVIIRDMRRIELWDAGRLLDDYAHDHSAHARRRRSLLTMPFYVCADLTVLTVAVVCVSLVENFTLSEAVLHRWLPLRVIPVFLFLVLFRTYRTVWSRAVLSNYRRLASASVLGAAATAVVVIFFQIPHRHFFSSTVAFLFFSVSGLFAVRLLRPLIRDLFYHLGAGRLAEEPDVARVLIYGCGLRYRSFRRELVRGTVGGRRVIVGLVDDDLMLKGRYIGGQCVYGGLSDLAQIARARRATAVVVTCELAPERAAAVRAACAAAGLPVTHWMCAERPL